MGGRTAGAIPGREKTGEDREKSAEKKIRIPVIFLPPCSWWYPAPETEIYCSDYLYIILSVET